MLNGNAEFLQAMNQAMSDIKTAWAKDGCPTSEELLEDMENLLETFQGLRDFQDKEKGDPHC